MTALSYKSFLGGVATRLVDYQKGEVNIMRGCLKL